jgi:hypothetical protein
MSAIGDAFRAVAALFDASPVPAPVSPAPSSSPYQVITSATEIDTILATGPDGPTLIHVYDIPNKVSWLAVRSYTNRDGTGAFIAFQCPGSDGVIRNGILLNGGFVGNNVARLNSDLDIIGMVDNVQTNLSFTGSWSGQPAMIGCWPAVLGVGGPSNPMLNVWRVSYPTIPGRVLPPGARAWVKEGTGYTAVY